MKREEKKRRLELMLKGLSEGVYLCPLYKALFNVRLETDFPEMKPKGAHTSDPWFGDYGVVGEEKALENRQKVLQQWILHYSDNCCEETQQLVDNVNQHGGSIYGLSVGDELPENIIKDWSAAGENYTSYRCKKPVKKTSRFIVDRVIEEFKVVGGEVFFLVSNTVEVYLRAKGYKKFAEEHTSQQRTYSIGNRFREEETGEEYVLAAYRPRTILLINLDRGVAYNPPIKVLSLRDITQEEFDRICNGQKFTKIDENLDKS